MVYTSNITYGVLKYSCTVFSLLVGVVSYGNNFNACVYIYNVIQQLLLLFQKKSITICHPGTEELVTVEIFNLHLHFLSVIDNISWQKCLNFLCSLAISRHLFLICIFKGFITVFLTVWSIWIQLLACWGMFSLVLPLKGGNHVSSHRSSRSVCSSVIHNRVHSVFGWTYVSGNWQNRGSLF